MGVRISESATLHDVLQEVTTVVGLREIRLTARIQAQDLRPHEHQHPTQISSLTLQQFQNIREDPDTQSHVDRPTPLVQEPSQELESSETMTLGQENLEDDRELHWLLHTTIPEVQPDLETGQLVLEKGTGFEGCPVEPMRDELTDAVIRC